MGTNDGNAFASERTDRGTAPSGQDLRKHLRVQIDDASTSFSIKGISTSLGSGRASRSRAAINLSEGGAMLLVGESIPVGSKVIVRIEIEDRGEFVEAGGEVRWCEAEGTNGKGFHAGIEFADLTPEDHRKIGRMREWFSSPEYKGRSATPPPP
jgi:c-di-GMP-binding flagellar brake protein YcgR